MYCVCTVCVCVCVVNAFRDEDAQRSRDVPTVASRTLHEGSHRRASLCNSIRCDAGVRPRTTSLYVVIGYGPDEEMLLERFSSFFFTSSGVGRAGWPGLAWLGWLTTGPRSDRFVRRAGVIGLGVRFLSRAVETLTGTIT